MKIESSLQSFELYSNIKFHENRSNGSRVDACERTDMKLIVAFAILQTRLKIWTA